jgi:hypothetical protein
MLYVSILAERAFLILRYLLFMTTCTLVTVLACGVLNVVVLLDINTDGLVVALMLFVVLE